MIKIYSKVDEACEDNPQTCCQQVRSFCAFDQIVVVVVVAFISSSKGLSLSNLKHKEQTHKFIDLSLQFDESVVFLICFRTGRTKSLLRCTC